MVKCVGDIMFVFDLLLHHGNNIRGQPYRDRLFAMNQIVSAGLSASSKLAETVSDSVRKSRAACEASPGERKAIVFNESLRPLRGSGRPASGGDSLKHKFVATASFIVNRVNEKRSVSLMLFNGDKVVPAGNVTIPPNHGIPPVGAVVECRYLYAIPRKRLRLPAGLSGTSGRTSPPKNAWSANSSSRQGEGGGMTARLSMEHRMLQGGFARLWAPLASVGC